MPLDAPALSRALGEPLEPLRLLCRREAPQFQRALIAQAPHGEPLVVAGDFNDWGSRIQRMLRQFGLYEYEDAQHALTYPARLPLAQLDHIYVRGLTPTGLQVPRGRIWWRMSDHLPLIAEFRW